MPVKTKRDEEKWQKAKELAKEAGHEEDYPYIIKIYKKMNPDYFDKSESSGIRSLHLLVQGVKSSQTLSERYRTIAEVTAYVMMTGRRGGRFYYTDQGKRVYGDLPADRARASTPSPSPARPKTKEEHDREWSSENAIPEVDMSSVGRSLWDLLGSKAPSPKEFAGMFSAMGIQAKITSASGYGKNVDVRFDVFDQDGTNIGNMSRSFFPNREGKGPEVHHNLFSLQEEAQDGGRCGAMFGQALDVYKKMGIAIASVDAGLTVGPYVWARFGFQPPEDSMTSIRREFTDFLQKPPIGLSGEAARQLVQDKGKTIHDLSGVRVRVEHLNPETGKPEFKMIKAGKHFFLHSRQGEVRGWSGDADLREPEVVARWEAQSAKGTETRKKALAEGKQNARTNSPSVVVRELAIMGDTDLSRRVREASEGRVYQQRVSAWDDALGGLLSKRASFRDPKDVAKIDSMLQRLAPFRQRIVDRDAYTESGRQQFLRDQEKARQKARAQVTPAPAPARAPTLPASAPVRPALSRPAAARAAVSPQAQTLLRRGKEQVALARAAAAATQGAARSSGEPMDATRELAQRAAKFSTTVAQERRIDQITQRAREQQLLKRREIRGLAQARGLPSPEFIPIRDWEQQKRALERAKLRSR